MRAWIGSLVATVLVIFAASAEAQDIGASREAICCGANCCAIAGGCQARGDENPADSCEVCDPSASQSAWTNTCSEDAGSGGVDAGTGGDDDGGCSVRQGSEPAPPYALLCLGFAFWLTRTRRRKEG